MKGSASSPPPPSGSSLQRSESAALVGGASLPPKSPQKDEKFIVHAVGIPTPKNAREITNRDESKYEDGYDSDGAIGPFLDAIADQTMKSVLDEDDALPASMLEGGEGMADPIRPEEEPWFMTPAAIRQLNVVGLKKEIHRRGFRPLGKKGDLRKMLMDCMEQRCGIIDTPVENMNALSGFPVGSRWTVLTPNLITVPDPVNEFSFHAPTDDPEYLPTVPKHNFDEQWDRPVFEGRSRAKGVRTKGETRIKFMRDSRLDSRSHPVDWVDAFLPSYCKARGSKSKTPYILSSDKLCKWSNEKAMLMQMGTQSMYPNFTPFTTEEFEKYLYLFFWNGLAPSPQISMKLESEDQNPIHSNHFLRRELGPNASRRLREWKCCFACQDPKLPIPPRKSHPNFKVDEYLRHIQLIFRYAWMPGRDLSGDEQTMGFKGRHPDKQRITYKKEGDGFQCDCLADDGYTFTFYFRNQPAPKHWLDQGLSPLHARCMALFDCLMDQYHQVRFDNLYMSAKFALASFQHPQKVLVEGVTRTNQRGLPKEIIQHEIKSSSKKDIAKVKGTVKAAVLEGCAPLNACPLVAASVYDNKGVHFLSTCVTKIEWIKKERATYDKVTGTMCIGTYLRLSINDTYNMNMNSVDMADQLRGNYRPDRWMRKMKWWWAMFFWGHGTLLVNAYIAYKSYVESKGMKALSHYDFRMQVVLAKICPAKYGSSKQKLSIAFQRGDYRALSRTGGSITSNTASTSSRSSNAKRASTIPPNPTPKKTRRPQITALRLCDMYSQANTRRLNDELQHLAEPESRNTGGKCCSLCRYATGKKYSAQLLTCKDCNVSLCMWCFKPFHTLTDLTKEKRRLCKQILARKNPKNAKS